MLLCNQCATLSSKDLQHCVYCKQPVTACFTSRDNTTGTKLAKILLKANLSQRDIVKYTLKIGFWPKSLSAEFHEHWLPSFDAHYGIFQQQIKDWSVKYDPNTSEYNMLVITMNQPYLYTKFLFSMENKVISHNGVFYMLTAVANQELYASA